VKRHYLACSGNTQCIHVNVAWWVIALIILVIALAIAGVVAWARTYFK
jgi:hypothetical protein